MSSNINNGPVISNNLFINSDLHACDAKFNVAHLNCQSIRPSVHSSKFDELKSILSGSRFHAIGISETWLKSVVLNRAIDIPGYKFVRNDRRHSRGGGVGIYVSNKLQHKFVFKAYAVGKCESLFLELCSGSAKILFGVTYLPPPGDIEAFEEIHHDLFVNYSNIIVVGDFNCNMFNVPKATQLRSMCARLNLAVLHNSRPTHYDVSHGTSSLIDFMLVSDISMKYYSNQVQCPSISHHSLIYASFDITVNCFEKFVDYRDYGNIDWDGLFLFLSSFDSSSIFYSTDTEVKCALVSSLIEELHSFVPTVRKRVYLNDDNWINSNKILFAQSLRDLAFSAYQNDRTRVNWRIYCKYRNKAKSVIRKAKRRHSLKRFNGLDNSKLWCVLRGSGCIGNDDMFFDGNADVVNNFFVRGLSSNDDAEVDFESIFETDNSFSFACVSSNEVVDALGKIRSKSIGVDGVSVEFLKIVFPHISEILLHLFNFILTTSSFPVSWKTARVVPIPKSTVINSPEDLRPISILPVLSKVLEHILKDQILSYSSEKILNSQYAFRKGHNTTSLLLHLTDSIRMNLNQNKLCVLVSLDLTKAFNSICYVSMIKKLRDEFNFSRTACRLVMSYLSGRSQFVELNGRTSSVLSLTSGVPQGSVLGPLLFILYINDISQYLNSELCTVFLFADDVFLLFSENRTLSNLLETNINLCLDQTLEWTLHNSLAINPRKTKAMLFGGHGEDLNISVDNNLIEFVDYHKCLGIIIDRRLTFGPHIDCVHRRIYGILRRFYSLNIYLPFWVKKRLAHALLMPQIVYGLEVISGTTFVNVDKLKRVMNMVVRYVYCIKRREHISEHVNLFLGTSFNNYINVRNLLLFHKVIKSGRPALLRDMFNFSRSIRNIQIFIPRIYNSVFERSFVVRVARWWNQLPVELRVFSHSNNAFRLKLLSYFLNFSRNF